MRTPRKHVSRKRPGLGWAAVVAAFLALLFFGWLLLSGNSYIPDHAFVSTVAGLAREFGEPFGAAVAGEEIFISDGQNDRIMKIGPGLPPAEFASGLDTPSGIAFHPDGRLIVADTGSNSIKAIAPDGKIETIAGTAGRSGHLDGPAETALFNAPVGVACTADGRIFVADTYNDRIRIIQNGWVTTVAGSEAGFSDGPPGKARFHTPTGLAVWGGRLLVADTGNRRIRVVEPDGNVWTLAGNGEDDIRDGLGNGAAFSDPSALAVTKDGVVLVADGGTVRRIGGGVLPMVTTITARQRGLSDGPAAAAMAAHISGIAVAASGDVVLTDSENRLLRRLSARPGPAITHDEAAAMHETAAEFRASAPGRWPFAPAHSRREIAGTLGEIRGELTTGDETVWFHNGLDIAGAYGETAYFVRDEKVLCTTAAENFETLRELLRLPTIGYIHVRLGRDAAGRLFDDPRFQFERDARNRITGVRIPRGTKFRAGDAVGTLNAMNHVHLVAGRSGSEMNALAALDLPGVSDSRLPVIEDVTVYDAEWRAAETTADGARIKLPVGARVVVRAYDQMDGNAERRRLGVYRLGYQLLDSDKRPLDDVRWTIVFDRAPANDAVKLAYAPGSRSGATGETVFRYLVTNFVAGGQSRASTLDTAALKTGPHFVRVFAEDYFGNSAFRDIEVTR